MIELELQSGKRLNNDLGLADCARKRKSGEGSCPVRVARLTSDDSYIGARIPRRIMHRALSFHGMTIAVCCQIKDSSKPSGKTSIVRSEFPRTGKRELYLNIVRI